MRGANGSALANESTLCHTVHAIELCDPCRSICVLVHRGARWGGASSTADGGDVRRGRSQWQAPRWRRRPMPLSPHVSLPRASM